MNAMVSFNGSQGTAPHIKLNIDLQQFGVAHNFNSTTMSHPLDDALDMRVPLSGYQLAT